MSITALPAPPSRSDPANFPERADAFMAALPQFATQANALQAQVNDAAATVDADASAAAASAAFSDQRAIAAAASAGESATTETAARVARIAAEAARDLAQAWASKPTGTVSGGLLSARQYAEQAAAAANVGLPQYLPSGIPASDVGPIYVIGLGTMEWRASASRYVTVAGLPRQYRAGGLIFQTTSNSITISAGSWRSRGDTADIRLTAPLTKVLQSSGTWAPGSGANGLFTGVAAVATSYHLFVIYNPATGVVDAGFDTSLTAANRPTGFTEYRRVSTERYTTTLAWLSKLNPEVGVFLFQDAVSPLSNVNTSTTFQTIALGTTLPPGVRSEAFINSTMNGANPLTGLVVASPELSLAGSALQRNAVGTFPNGSVWSVAHKVITDQSAQLKYATTAATTGAYLMYLTGYRDFLED